MQQLPFFPVPILLGLLLLVAIDLILRGMALWGSAGRRQLVWFIALFVINSLGILPLIYLLIYGVTRKHWWPVNT